MVELHDVANNLLHVLHPQIVKLVFSVSDGVMQTKLELEFHDEFLPIVHPKGTIICIEGTKEVGLEPFKCHTFEVQLHKCNFGLIHIKGSLPILKIKLTLHQEGAELHGVGTIEGVWFVDASMQR